MYAANTVLLGYKQPLQSRATVPMSANAVLQNNLEDYKPGGFARAVSRRVHVLPILPFSRKVSTMACHSNSGNRQENETVLDRVADIGLQIATFTS